MRIHSGIIGASTPAILQTLAACYIASPQTCFQTAGGSAATADGDPVGQWQDQSGNGRHLTQATGANKPTLATDAINVQPAVRFNGSAAQMSLSDSVSLDDFTLFAVCRACPPGPGTKVLLGDGADTKYFVNHSGYDISFNPGSAVSATNVPRDTWQCVELKRSGTTLTVTFNNVLFSTHTVGTGTIPLAMIGAGSATASFWKGDVAALFVADRVLSADEITEMRAYIRNKYHCPGPESYTVVGGPTFQGPAWARLDNGELFVSCWSLEAVNKFVTLRSTDSGLTFSEELRQTLKSGFTVYHNVGMIQLANGNVFIPSSDVNNTGAQEYVLWSVSADRGHTIPAFSQLDLGASYSPIAQPYGRCFESGGSLYLLLYAKNATPHAENPTNNDSLIFQSNDGGTTFAYFSRIAAAGTPDLTSSYNETAVVPWSGSNWVALMRYSHGPDGADPATGRLAFSADGGATWGASSSFCNEELMVSPHLLKTQSGRLLATYGSRQVTGYDAGIRARLSPDGGTTWWDYFVVHNRVVNNDGAYPDVVEVSAGVFWVMFYDEHNRIILRRFLEADMPTAAGIGSGVVVDSFDTTGWNGTDADGTALTAHAANTGGLCWRHDSGTWEVRAGRANCTSAPGSLGLASADGGSANRTVTCKIPQSGFAMAVVGRLTDANNFWMAYLVPNQAKLRLYKVSGGVYSVEANLPTTLFDGMTVHLTFADNSITMAAGDDSITITDGTHNAATRYGIYSEGVSRQMDDFKVTT